LAAVLLVRADHLDRVRGDQLAAGALDDLSGKEKCRVGTHRAVGSPNHLAEHGLLFPVARLLVMEPAGLEPATS
jgi:hypothetical protein